MFDYSFEFLTIVIVTVGVMLQTWTGIGFGLVAAPLLFLINPAFVPGPILIMAMLLSTILVISERKQLRWRRISPAIIARIPGAWCGALLLTLMPHAWLSILFGAALLFAILVSHRKFEIPFSRTSLISGGFFSGLLGTATSVGGPPIALVYQNQDRITARNEISAFFFTGSFISVAVLFSQGLIDQQTLQLSMEMLPGVLIGCFIAKKLDNRISTQSAKPALQLMSLVSAIMVISKGIYQIAV